MSRYISCASGLVRNPFGSGRGRRWRTRQCRPSGHMSRRQAACKAAARPGNTPEEVDVRSMRPAAPGSAAAAAGQARAQQPREGQGRPEKVRAGPRRSGQTRRARPHPEVQPQQPARVPAEDIRRRAGQPQQARAVGQVAERLQHELARLCRVRVLRAQAGAVHVHRQHCRRPRAPPASAGAHCGPACRHARDS